MEQARQRRRRQAALLAEHPHCIYCGGVRKATTIDHMPPRIMFRSKLRPGQLEFPSCDPCNQLTKASDQVAALVGRFLPDAVTPEEKADFRKILTGLKNNMRPVLEEMNLGTAEEEQVRRRTTAYAGVPGGFIYLGGPLMQGYLNAFGCKLALAMHWEATKLIVPVQGGVALRVYSNVDAIEGKLPRALLNLLPPELHTLKQGRWNVHDQFEYSQDTQTSLARQYLRLAVENYKRAGVAESPELKAKFMEIAARYRDLGLQLDDPAQWGASLIESARAAAKRK